MEVASRHALLPMVMWNVLVKMATSSTLTSKHALKVFKWVVNVTCLFSMNIFLTNVRKISWATNIKWVTKLLGDKYLGLIYDRWATYILGDKYLRRKISIKRHRNSVWIPGADFNVSWQKLYDRFQGQIRRLHFLTMSHRGENEPSDIGYDYVSSYTIDVICLQEVKLFDR